MKLEDIRKPDRKVAIREEVFYSILIFIFGAGMGLMSKVLDTGVLGELPSFLGLIDIVNFLGRFAIWIFIGVCISIYSISAWRAAMNVFLFFAGMVGAYYLYSFFGAGFFPTSYAMIWIALVVVTPLLGAVCWYAKGEGPAAVVISGIILGVLFAQAVFLFQGVRIAFLPELVIWIISVIILRREPREFALEMVISVAVAALYQLVIPFWG